MKKIIIGYLFIIMCIFMASCGIKSKTPEFADDLIVKLSYTPVDVNSDELTYTINIEIYQDSNICIYADNFIKWYGEDEPEIVNYTVSSEELEMVKKSIIDNNLYNLQRNVGNKNNMAGVMKNLTVYTKEGEYSVYGINPSNKSFNNVFEMIIALKREELADYINKINNIQKNGAENDIGIYITDDKDNVIFEENDVSDIYVVDFDEIHKKIAFELKDSVSEKYNNMTNYLDEEEYVTFKLYNDKAFMMTLVGYKSDEKCIIYSGISYDGDSDELQDIIKDLKEGLK